MKLKNLLFLFVCLFAYNLYSEDEVDIDIIIIIPPPTIIIDYRDVEIGSMFTPNHQSYPRHKYINTPIFSSEEAFAILNKNSTLFGNLPRGTFINLHLTTGEESNKRVYFSVSEKNIDAKSFYFIPLSKKDKTVAVKLFLIDLSRPTYLERMREIQPNESYAMKDVAGKTLFLLIPNKGKKSFQTVDFNKYRFPLEVQYSAP